MLSKSNKDKLVGGLITVLLLALTYYVKDCFGKDKIKDSTQTQVKEQNNNTSNDSSNQKNVTQQISGNAQVKTEITMGNKITYPQTKKQKETNETKPVDKTQSDEKIENNGNLSMYQSGGIVNQATTINPSKKFTDLEKSEIIKNLNIKNSLRCIQITPNQANPKSFELSEDLENFLKKEGYQIIPNTNIWNDPGINQKVRYMGGPNSCTTLIITSI